MGWRQKKHRTWRERVEPIIQPLMVEKLQKELDNCRTTLKRAQEWIEAIQDEQFNRPFQSRHVVKYQPKAELKVCSGDLTTKEPIDILERKVDTIRFAKRIPADELPTAMSMRTAYPYIKKSVLRSMADLIQDRVRMKVTIDEPSEFCRPGWMVTAEVDVLET